MKRFCVFLAVALSCAQATLGNSVVDNIIKAVRDDLSKRNISEVSLPDVTWNYFIVSGQIKNTVSGALSTLYVDGDDQVLEKDSQGNVRFDLHLGLKNFRLSYDFSYKYLDLFNPSGTFSSSSDDNKIRLAGTITALSTGVCKATLTKATVKDLGKFEVSLKHSSWFHSFWQSLITFYMNHFGTAGFNSMISKHQQLEAFKSTFSEIACHSIGYQ
uniref:Secreted protein n=1 Tax=Riptortus pedestris TaxID=329032 RepID=R4WQ84_RIPPE|nr:unknown secreted protein [Riptortus pedestris]